MEEPAAKKADVDTTLPDAPANSKQIVKQIEVSWPRCPHPLSLPRSAGALPQPRGGMLRDL